MLPSLFPAYTSLLHLKGFRNKSGNAENVNLFTYNKVGTQENARGMLDFL